MKKETMSSEKHDTLLPVAHPHFSASTRGNSRPLPHACSQRGTPGMRTNIFPIFLSRQSLKTRGRYVLIVFSIFAAGPCQLWKAENRALLGLPGPAPMVSSLRYLLPLFHTCPIVIVARQRLQLQSPPASCTACDALLASPCHARGGEAYLSNPQLGGILLDYSFNTTPVAVVQVMRFPWEVVLTDPHKFHVHRVADPEEKHPSTSVSVLAVQAQGPYVAVWILDPGVLLEAEEPQRAYRFQLAILPGAVTKAEDGRSVKGSTRVFTVSEQSVADDLLFLDMMTPAHIRVSGTKATHPSGPEATRALFLTGEGLDPDPPPTPLARIVARRNGSPKIPPGFFEAEASQGR